MIRVLVVGLVCCGLFEVAGALGAAAADVASAIEWEASDWGETAFVTMKSAPFPHPSRDKGYTYNKVTFAREPHYSDSTVGLFLPHGYRRTRVDVLLYLHGWGNNVRKAISQYKLREQVAASGRNIVLVFPEGPRDASDSGCGKLEDKDGLRHLVEESLSTLHAAGKIDQI